MPGWSVTKWKEVEGRKVFASYLTPAEYSKQLMDPDAKWICPKTRIEGWFDDVYFEESFANK